MQRPKDTGVKFALENVLPGVAADFLEICFKFNCFETLWFLI